MAKNIAVVGCGHWGKNLVRNFAELGALCAVCDPNEELAQKFSDEYSVPIFSFDEITESNLVKGVVIAVPAPLHSSMAIAAMNSGKHVYVEKPLAMNDLEAKAMIDCSLEKKKHLMVGHLLQYHPIFRELKRFVESGKIGDLHYIYSNRLSFGKLRMDEDVIWSFAPHDVSMVLSLVGSEPLSVRAEAKAILQPNISDIATLYLEFPGNVKAQVSVSWLHPEKEQKLVVIGSNGMLVFDDTKLWTEKLAYHSHSSKGFPEVAGLLRGEKHFIEVHEAEPLREECSHFLDVVLGTVKPRTDGEEGLRVLSVLMAASRDLRDKVYKKELD